MRAIVNYLARWGMIGRFIVGAVASIVIFGTAISLAVLVETWPYILLIIPGALFVVFAVAMGNLIINLTRY